MNGVTVKESALGATVYVVEGVESAAAVNQAKKAHVDAVGCAFYDLTARKVPDERHGTTVVVVGPERETHRLAAAEPRTQPEAGE
ncbi:hypothetical protein OSG_eHP27_00020 [environmental Halophage eHP-27]|jgi:phosphoribosylanthranilate isomerase|nr:hypothetical protein OSG_eHP27_00020 [environmental Halophage eHP-27]